MLWCVVWWRCAGCVCPHPWVQPTRTSAWPKEEAPCTVGELFTLTTESKWKAPGKGCIRTLTFPPQDVSSSLDLRPALRSLALDCISEWWVHAGTLHVLPKNARSGRSEGVVGTAHMGMRGEKVTGCPFLQVGRVCLGSAGAAIHTALHPLHNASGGACDSWGALG